MKHVYALFVLKMGIKATNHSNNHGRPTYIVRIQKLSNWHEKKGIRYLTALFFADPY